MSHVHFELVVDPTACDGHGLCAELLPESIRLDPWGFPVIDPSGISPDLVDHARRAAVACPKLALTLVRQRRSRPRGQ